MSQSEWTQSFSTLGKLPRDGVSVWRQARTQCPSLWGDRLGLGRGAAMTVQPWAGGRGFLPQMFRALTAGLLAEPALPTAQIAIPARQEERNELA